MTSVRRRYACLVSLGMIMALALVVAPSARASGPPTWTLAVSASCSGGSVCGGFTTLTGSCSFVGTASGSTATCHALLIGDIGVVTEAIAGTAWDMEPGLLTPATGAADFFISDGMNKYTGPAAVGAIAAGLPQALGCAIAGATFTCPLAVVEAAGLYSPDTLDPVIVGHYASNVCFGTGVVDSGCSFIQQLTFVD